MTPRITYSSTRSLNGTIDDSIALCGRFEFKGYTVKLEQHIDLVDLQKSWMKPAEQFLMGFRLIRAALRNERARMIAGEDSLEQIHIRYAGEPASRALLADANARIAELQSQEKAAGFSESPAGAVHRHACICLLRQYRDAIRRKLVGLR